VGIVVFMIGAATGKLDGLFSFGEVSQEMMVPNLGKNFTLDIYSPLSYNTAKGYRRVMD
jgi:hypothetical protein